MFKILLSNCCGLDVHKTWILACIGITDNNNNCSVNVGCKCTDNLRPARCIVPCIIVHQISQHLRRDSNPCYRLERAMS